MGFKDAEVTLATWRGRLTLLVSELLDGGVFKYGETERARRHLRSTNLLGLLFFASTAPYATLLVATRVWALAALMILGLVGYISPLFLLRRGHIRLGKTLPLLSVCVLVYVLSSMLGKSSNLHLALFMTVTWSFNIFDLVRERWLFRFSLLTALATFALVQSGGTLQLSSIAVSPAVLDIMHHTMAGMCLLMLIVVLLHFYSKKQVDEDRLVESLSQLIQEVDRRAMAEAKENAASQAKTDFLSLMGHELRTPLNGVLGMSQLLRDSSLNADQQNLLEHLESSGQELMLLLNDILDFVSVRSGETAVVSTPLDLVTLIEETVRNVGELSRQRRVDVDLIIEPNVPLVVLGDASRIRQVLTCVVDNALKYTERGWVCVEVSCRKRDGQHWVEVDVTDTGRGIPAHKRQEIFEEFAQTSGGAARDNSGVGLGLAMCRNLLTAMDGDITLGDTADGRGSCFHLKWPATIREQPPVEGSLCDLSISIEAEDTRAERALRSIIQRLGAEVVPPGTASAIALKIDNTVSIEPPKSGADSASPGRTLTINGHMLCRSRVEKLLAPFTRLRVNATEHELKTRLSGLRVLVVEDNPVNQKVLCRLLAKLGATQVQTAENGQKAVDLCREQNFDLILMDVEMPVMNGLDATRTLRQEFASTMHIVGVSANAAPQEQQTGLEAGMDLYLPKPISKKRLVEALERLL